MDDEGSAFVLREGGESSFFEEFTLDRATARFFASLRMTDGQRQRSTRQLMVGALLASPWRAGADPCSLGSAISRRDGWELTAHPSRLAEQHAAVKYAQPIASPEESPFGRSQTLKCDRLRQPTYWTRGWYNAPQPRWVLNMSSAELCAAAHYSAALC